MKRTAWSLTALALLLLAAPSRATEPVYRADVDTIPAAASAQDQMVAAAELIPIYDNIPAGPSTYFYRGQLGEEAIDDVHGTRAGVLTRIEFRYYEPGTETFSAEVRVYGNPEGLDQANPLVGGPYVLNDLQPGVQTVSLSVSGGPMVGPDLWVGIRFTSVTAGLALSDDPSAGSSHDHFLENGTLYYFGGHPKANFALRVSVRRPVVPGADAYAVDEDHTLQVEAPGVLANDGEDGGEGLSAALVSDVAHGVLSLGPDGSFSYTPAPDFAGTDGFAYTAIRDPDLTATGSVQIVVNAINDAPVARDDAFEMDEDGTLTGDALANDEDAEGDALGAALAAEPEHGSLTFDSNGTFTYTPEPDFHGQDSFRYVASDGQLPSNEALVSITVHPVNDPPTAADDTTTARSGIPATITVTANDGDLDGDAIAVSGVTQGDHGTVAIGGDDAVVYTAAPAFVGRDTFSYTIADPSGASDTAQVAVQVVFGLPPPVVIEGPYTYGGHTYALLSFAPWEDSEAAAVALGGHLVTIDDEAEQAWIYDTFTQGGTSDRSLWIGLTDRAEEGVFAWAGGEPVGYTHWQAGQPDQCSGQPENYAAMLEPSSGAGGYWDDCMNEGGGGCGGQRYPQAVVEVPVVVCHHLLSVGVLGGGTVTCLPDLPDYDCDVSVQLTASASPGWVFTGWDGDASGQDSVISMVMDGDKSLTASFALVIGFDFKPNSIKVKEKEMHKRADGNFEAPPPFSAAQILVPSIRLNGVVPVDSTAKVELREHDGIMRLKVKFRRGDLYQTLPLGDRVPVVATGTIGADRFVGYDSVKVKRGKVHKPHHGDVLTSGETYWVVYEISSEEAVEWVELLSSFDGGVNWTTELSQLPNTGEIAWPVPPVPAESVLVAVVEVEAEGDSSDEVIGVLGTSEYFAITAPLAVGEAAATLELAPPEPSPSSRDVTLRFSLPRRGQVSLEIYDVQGRKVRTLDSSIREAGRHRLVWRGECDSGESAGPGLYFVRLKADRRAIQRTVVWLR